MTIYTVHEPPAGVGSASAHLDRFVFIRDGFSWGAFLLAPLWMVRHRLWLALVLYAAVATGIAAAARFLHASALLVAMIAFVISLLIGLEASSLRRWALSRRKWATVGVVVDHDLEVAERRFFDAWLQKFPTATRSSAAMPTRGAAPATIIGLFPEAEV